MSKELEALERIDNTLCLNNIKGKLEFGIDTEEHTDCDSVIGMTEDLETIKSALTEYEAIKNTEPSEALDYLDRFLNEMTYCLKHPKEYVKGYDKEIFYKYQYTFETTIKQALLKAQELPEPFKTGVDIGVIKPKQYLKWEDIAFSYGTSVQKVRMNGTIYKIAYRYYEIEEIQLLSEDEKLLYFSFVGKFKDNIQLFNDLHLERVEE